MVVLSFNWPYFKSYRPKTDWTNGRTRTIARTVALVALLRSKREGVNNIEERSASIRMSSKAAMTGRNTLITTAAGVVDTIEQVWYLAVVVAAVHRFFFIFSAAL